jgi:glycosyltransferase involved in cell wall biosynthesis
MPSILIVSAFFPPSLRIGSRRPARMALSLARSGWDVTVLTMNEWRNVRPVDMREEPMPPGVRVIRTGAWMPIDTLRRAGVALTRRLRRGSSSEGRGASAPPGAPSPRGDWGSGPRTAPAPEGAVLGVSPAGALKLWCARRLADLEFPDKYAGWLPYALLAARGQRWDVVLATIPPYTPAVIARALSARTGSPLVLDYRDPWTEAPRRDFGEGWHEGLRDRHRRLEDWCLAGTSLAVGVAPGICRFLEARTRADVLFAPNSYDEDDPAFRRAVAPAAGTAGSPAVSPRRMEGTARLVYAGTLAYGRSLDPVLAAIARLAPGVGSDRLRLVYAGPDGARVRRDAAARGVESFVEDLGTLGAGAAAALVRDATAVVVAVSEGYEYQYPGKIFDVVAARRPVLLLAPPGADAAELVRRHRLGWTHEPSEVEGLAESIRKAIAGETFQPEGLEIFETGRVMASLDAALRRLA